MSRDQDINVASPKRLLHGLEKNLRVVVKNLQRLPDHLPLRKSCNLVTTLNRLERTNEKLSRLVGSPSLIAAFAEELAKRPIGNVDPPTYFENQKSMIKDLKAALEGQGTRQIEKIRELLRVVEGVAQQELKRGRPKNPNYAMLDQIIIFEAIEYGNKTGKCPTIYIDSKTGHPGPFLRQVLDALAMKSLDFSYDQIRYRIKPLKAHPIHGAFFN